MNHNLFSGVYPMYLSSGIQTGSTDVETAWIDMRGYQGIAFLVGATSTDGETEFNVHVQMSATSSGASAIDVANSAATFSSGWGGADPCGLVVDVYRPMYRYVQCLIDRSSSGQRVESIWGLKYRAESEAVSFSTSFDVQAVTMVVGSSGSATG